MGMHRIGVAALAFCAVLVSVAPAQKTTAFGVMAGGTFSKFGGADVQDAKTHVGFAAGGFVTLGLSPSFALQPELLFVQKGAKDESDPNLTATIKLSYLEMPLLAKFRLPAKGNGGQISPHAYGGGAIAFRLGCRIKVASGSTSLSSDCEDDPDTEVKKTDFSLIFGLGVDIGRAMIDARYDLGLSTLDGSSEHNDVKNRTFYLLAGWTFRSPM